MLLLQMKAIIAMVVVILLLVIIGEWLHIPPAMCGMDRSVALRAVSDTLVLLSLRDST